jgi:recombination protein RecA
LFARGSARFDGSLEPVSKAESITAVAAISPQLQGRAPLWEHWSAGQLLELSGSSPGKLSTVVRLLLREQASGGSCAWVAPGGTRGQPSFYPPDFASAGVDLGALVVVRLPCEAGPHAVVRACEILLRSGAFGLLVVDLSQAVPRGELAWQSRLAGLSRAHDARVVLLTPSAAQEPSLGPMVGLRLEPQLGALSSARVSLGQRVLKSKLGALSISPDVRELPAGAVRPA